jgi:hypothetical protein
MTWNRIEFIAPGVQLSRRHFYPEKSDKPPIVLEKDDEEQMLEEELEQVFAPPPPPAKKKKQKRVKKVAAPAVEGPVQQFRQHKNRFQYDPTMEDYDYFKQWTSEMEPTPAWVKFLSDKAGEVQPHKPTPEELQSLMDILVQVDPNVEEDVLLQKYYQQAPAQAKTQKRSARQERRPTDDKYMEAAEEFARHKEQFNYKPTSEDLMYLVGWTANHFDKPWVQFLIQQNGDVQPHKPSSEELASLRAILVKVDPKLDMFDTLVNTYFRQPVTVAEFERHKQRFGYEEERTVEDKDYFDSWTAEYAAITWKDASVVQFLVDNDGAPHPHEPTLEELESLKTIFDKIVVVPLSDQERDNIFALYFIGPALSQDQLLSIIIDEKLPKMMRDRAAQIYKRRE